MSPNEVNLRAAVDPTQSCANCNQFQQGMCTTLGMPVQPNQMCDAWAPQGGEAPAPQGPAPMDSETMSAMLFGGPK